MDNKIKYVDLNGLKVFAEALKQDLKNHVLELGLYQELLHRIENLELYKIVDSLPEIGDEDTIYLLKNPSGSGDKNVFIEYLYNNEHGWEEIGNFTPSFDLEDYLKVEDAPFEKGEAENSAVLKGGNNQVISEGSVALGKDNISGLKGWYYKAVQIGNDGNVVYLYLTTEQQIPVLVSSASAVENQEKDININISKGDICSIINGNRLIDCFEVRLNEMSKYGRISFIYKGEGTNPLYTIQNVEELKLEDYSVFCISKPSYGIVELSKCNIALGNSTKSLAESSVAIGLRSTAAGITTYAEGQDTIAVGECAHAEGAFTKANGIASHTEGFGTQTEELSAHAEGYNTLATGGASHAEGSATKATGLHSHAEGDTTEASGEQSHAEGQSTKAEGYCSHAEGNGTIAKGSYSHAEGYGTTAEGYYSHAEGVGTQTKNNGEHAEGRFNKSNSAVPNDSNPGNTAHSVGIGTSSADRKNAHEIMQDGKHYILGVGGYDGTNPDKATDVASQLTELSDAIALRNIGAEDTDESVEEPEIGGGGGASSDKQGVVSQTLTYNTADNTYSVSNVVRGSIPSFFIDLVTEAGASFNVESGYFSLNGIDNIDYDEMRQIYNCRTGYGVNSLLAVYGKTYTARTNFAAFRGTSFSASNHEPTTIYTKYLGYQNASITKFALSDFAIEVKTGSANNFDSFGSGGAPLQKSRFEEIIGIICVTNLTGSNNFFYNGAWHPWLTTFQLKSLKASIDLSGMPRLSEATILYMINNEKAASAITIKLHADAKAMADASEAIQSALANHANITLGV